MLPGSSFVKKLWPVLLLIGAAQEPERDRSPGDLALSPNGRWVISANRTSDSVSLVDLAGGNVSAELKVGRKPFGIDWRGAVAVVANWGDDSVTLIDVAPPKLGVVATIQVGNEPRGVVLSPDASRAYVVVSGDNAVDVIDLTTKKAVARIPVGSEPWYAALTPDGSRLAVGNALSGDVSLIDTAALKVAATIPMKGRNLRRVAVSPDGAWAYVPHITDRGASTTLQNIERGLVLDNRVGRVPFAGGDREAMGLDTKGFGSGDPEGVAVSPDGGRLAVTLGGTRDLLLLRLPLPLKAEPGEFLPDELLKDKTRYRRVSGLRGRPLGCVFTPDGKSVIVANALGNEIQVVDWEAGEIVRAVSLGGPKEPSLARQGEKIFYDAYRSWHEWYSCNTCHSDGHTNGGIYDTFNDGKYGNAKKTLSLRGVTKTPPWTWHGHESDFSKALQGSFTKTMARGGLNRQELAAVAAYLETIDFAPAPRDVPVDAARRGAAIFKEKACDACHSGPAYTSNEVMLVGLEAPDDVFKGFNPPSLRGVTKRGPWLHDGRARTLDEVLLQHHRPLKLNGKPDLTSAELSDLLAFLRSL
jgi:YVTN family beta-propeller protein